MFSVAPGSNIAMDLSSPHVIIILIVLIFILVIVQLKLKSSFLTAQEAKNILNWEPVRVMFKSQDKKFHRTRSGYLEPLVRIGKCDANHSETAMTHQCESLK